MFNGVIASRGRAEALVQLGDQSGTVQVGDVGNPSTPWLPAGWKVAAIDAHDGTVTLRNGNSLRKRTIND